MTDRNRPTVLLFAALAVAGVACARQPAAGTAGDTVSPPGADAQQGAPTDTSAPSGAVGSASDTSALQRLEREARAMANVEGCEQSGQCRTAPLGSRPCGGPRGYLVYCPLTTDSAALFRKLDELARAEEAHNRQSGMISTCELRMPPTVEVAGGRCVAKSGP